MGVCRRRGGDADHSCMRREAAERASVDKRRPGSALEWLRGAMRAYVDGRPNYVIDPGHREPDLANTDVDGDGLGRAAARMSKLHGVPRGVVRVPRPPQPGGATREVHLRERHPVLATGDRALFNARGKRVAGDRLRVS